MSEIQKVLNYPRGGGGASLFGNFSQIFPFFYSDASPYMMKIMQWGNVNMGLRATLPNHIPACRSEFSLK